jgi:hypothetical protein
MADRSIADEARHAGGTVLSAGANQLHGLAEALHDAAGHLHHKGGDFAARTADRAATGLDRFAERLERSTLRDMMRDTEHYAQRRPDVFLGSAFALGFMAARFLKSSGQRATEETAQDPPADIAGAWPPQGVATPSSGPATPGEPAAENRPAQPATFDRQRDPLR